jgi:Leucine-rich repeat (LRR) protein
MELPDCGRKELTQWNPSSNNSPRVNSMNYFTTLLLSNNSLSGGFPLFVLQCPNLIFLDLTRNKFTGELPGWVSEVVPNLVVLRLGSNNFSGHIPIEILGLGNVSILDLSNNNFSGAIPQYLENLKALTTSHSILADNPFEEIYYDKFGFTITGLYDDSFSVVIKGQVLDYGENTIFLRSIDL